MEWSELHDISLCREMIVVNPFKSKRKTTQRTKMWDTIIQHLENIESPTFKVTVRSVRDRYSLISRKYRKRMQDEKKASGIVPELSELDKLLEELIELEDLSEEERQNENEDKNKKIEQDQAKAIDVRKKAMEKLSETQKRKAQDEGEVTKKKSRRSQSDTMAYLKEKNEKDLELRKQELEFKTQQLDEDRRKQDEASKRQEDMMTMMSEQNQMMMQLMCRFLQR